MWAPKTILKSMKKCIQKCLIVERCFFIKNGAKMEARPNGDQNGGISWTFRDPPPGALQGRVWGGFWMDFEKILGGFWMDLGGFWEDFEWTLGRFLIEVSEVFWLKLVFSQERPKQQNGPTIDANITEKLESLRILANPRNPSESWRILGILANRRKPGES